MTTPSNEDVPQIPREFAVTLRTGDQRTVSVQRHGDSTVRLLAGADASATFRLVMVDPDRFGLRLHEGSEYLSIRDGSIRLSADFGTPETFQLVQSSDPRLFGFRSLGADRHLSAPPGAGAELGVNAERVGETELFAFEPAPIEGTEEHRSCCCGPAPRMHAGSDTLWDEYTHFRIVELAVHLLGNMQNPTREATFVHSVWQAGNAKAIREGLKGADEWDDWKPTHPIWAMYYYHFFDPRSGHSFPRPPEWYPHNARSKGAETFNGSVARYRNDADKRQACIYLGLTLHYLTDLCQPMHAANFINMPLTGDWRHAGYETYAEDYVANRNFFKQPGGYPALQRSEIEDTSPTPDQWLDGVAVQSVRTWTEVLEAEAAKKEIIRPGPHGPVVFYINKWGAEADASLMRSLWLAPRNTARYLCMWANRVLR